MVATWIPKGDEVLTHNLVSARHCVDSMMVRRLPSVCPLCLIVRFIDAGCEDDDAARVTLTRVTLTNVRVVSGVSPLFQILRFFCRSVFGFPLPGKRVFGMIPPLRFGLLFPQRKESGMIFHCASGFGYLAVILSPGRFCRVDMPPVDDVGGSGVMQ